MNYAKESMNLEDFYKLCSGTLEREDKTDNSRNRRALLRDDQDINAVSFSSDLQYDQVWRFLRGFFPFLELL